MTKANVRLREENRLVTIEVTGSDKPEVGDDIRRKWQTLVDLVAEIFHVPSGLVMKVNRKDIEVFIRSETPGNPYEAHARERLGSGLYCETVLGKDSMMSIPNALRDPAWHDNPDVSLEMVSYLGLPIKWSDETMFGTICILDNKERTYEGREIALMGMFREIIETDLRLLETNHKLSIASKTDPLTGLWNRQCLCDAVKERTGEGPSGKDMFSVAMIDLDTFKSVNDTYGHRTGDLVLSRFADFLKKQLGKDVFLGRYGGDEFVAVFDGMETRQAQARLDAVLEAMASDPWFMAYSLSFTYGVVMRNALDDDGMDMLDAADKIMMHKKKDSMGSASS